MKFFYLKCLAVLGLVTTISFTANAQCTGLTAPFTETFSGTTIPACWTETVASPGSGWVFSGSTSNYLSSGGCSPAQDHTGDGGSYAWVDQSSTDPSTFLESDVIDISALTTPYLEFYYFMCGGGYTPPNRLYIEAFDGTNWNPVDSILQGTQGWEEFGYDLSSHVYNVNSVKIRFRAESGGSSLDYYGDNAIDDLSVKEAPTCFKPTALNVTNVTSSGADFGWTDLNMASAWEIEYGAPGYTQGTGTASIVSSNPTTITTMSPATAYDLYVRAVCAPGDLSEWEGPVSVTTACLSTLSGAYTIGGAGADFADIAAAATSLNTCGISGPVTFNVAAGTYTGAAMIGEVTGNSMTNTISFIGAGAATTTITHDATGQNATILLEGADYVTFQDLTIQTTGTNDAWGVRLTNRSDNVTITDCIIDMPTNITTSSSEIAGIVGSASPTASSTGGDNAHNLTVSNTTVIGGWYGLRLEGGGASNVDSTVSITNCLFDGNGGYGIYFDDVDDITISNTTINGYSTTSKDGIYNSDVSNYHYDALNINVEDWGIYFTDGNDAAISTPNGQSTITNCMVYSDDDEALYGFDMNNTDIYHNTFVSGGTSTSAYAMYQSSDDNNVIKNNIFHSAAGYAVYISSAASNAVIDYNIYYNTGTNLAYYGGAKVDLATWQTDAPTLNMNSLVGDASFAGPTDFHLVGTIANDVGTPIATVTTDIDGDTRSATTPDIGADEFTPPSCSPPGALMATNVLATSANLGWTAGGTETMWDVEYGTAGFTQGAGTMVTATTSNPYAATMLTANTAYEFYVRANCGGATSPWIGPISFSTACASFTAPYMENFDGLALTSPYTALPSCWDSQTGPDYWGVTDDVTNTGHTYLPNIGDHTTGSGNYMWIDASSDITANEMVTPLIDMSGLTAPYAGFWFASDNTNNNVNHTINLDAWDGTAWVNIATESGNFTGWVEVAALVPASIPTTTKFRIYATADPAGNSGTYFYNDLGVDDFFVIQGPTCFTPTSLAATNLTQTSADLGWTPTGTETAWEVEYGTAGFVQGTGTAAVVTTNPYNVTGLTANTSYDFYVRAVCAPGDTSGWSSASSFFTGYCTPAPSSVDGDGIVNVTMGTINNTTSAETGNYGDYTSMVTGAVQGSTFNIDVTYQTGYTYNTWVWVDWNNDLDFDDAGEEFYLGESGSANPTTLSGSIMIPATATPGNYRIRIGGADSGLGSTSPSDPCYTGTWAAFEDYTLNVTLPLADDVRVAAITAGNCSDMETVTIDITNLGTNTQTSIPVSYSVNGGTPVMETWTGSLANGMTVQYTFAATFDASAAGTYNLNASTDLAVDGDMTNDMSSMTVTTAPAYMTTFFEDFEGSTSVPMDWSSDGSVTNGHNSGSNVLYRNMYSSVPSFTTTSPKITIAAGDMASFAYRYSDYLPGTTGTTLGAGDTMNVQISTDCGATFTTVGQVHAGNHTPTADYTTLSYDMTPYAGQTVVFRMAATWGTGDYYLDIDNVFVGTPMTQSATSTDALCAGAANGTGTITAADGVAPYTYNWSNGATTAMTSTLSAGVNYYTVTDATGAMIMDSVTIGEPAMAMSAMASVDMMVSCNGATDASVSATAMNGTAPYSYAWTNGMMMDTLMNVGAGAYAVLVTDANGCTAFTSVVVTEPDAMSATTMAADISCNGAADGTGDVMVSGGTGAYTYAWSNAATTASLTGLGAGTYTVTATDANNCMVMDSVTIAEPMAITAAAATDADVTCNGDTDGAVSVTASGGTGTLSYAWSNGSALATVTGIAAGTYDVTVTDANGCTMTSSATVAEPDALVLTMSSVPDSLRMGMGSATATVSGGTAPYTYAWDNGGTTATLTDLVEGLLTVVVTDANGCTVSGFVDVADVVSTNLVDYVTDLSIYPNPARNNTVIDLELSQNADIAISVYTVTGVLVQDFGKENTSRVTETIDVSNYAEGLYLVRFVIDNQIVTKKLIVTK